MTTSSKIISGWLLKKRDYTKNTQSDIQKIQRVFGQRLRIRLEPGEGLMISAKDASDQSKLDALMIHNSAMWKEPTRVNT